MDEALAKHGYPEIFNTDQGGQRTPTYFFKALASRDHTVKALTEITSCGARHRLR